MRFKPAAIHQFHGGSAQGDAITNGLLYTRDLLRELGFRSEIYCQDVAPELAGTIRSAPTFDDAPDVLLLVHFSWAIRYFDWLTSLRCRKILIFHNITPQEFFDEDGEFARFADLSWQQLARLRPHVTASLANSQYSAYQLGRAGYERPTVLPLLLDPRALAGGTSDEPAEKAFRDDDSLRILFVGRIVANKRQDALLEVVRHLKRDGHPRPPRLFLAGGIGAGHAYGDELASLARDLGVADCVNFLGKVSDTELRDLYRGCDVFLSLSKHEGFCVPLIEAMAFDLPVVALASSAVPETVGSGGLLLENDDPATVAGVVRTVADEPELRRRLILAGRANNARYTRAAALEKLARFLRDEGGVDVSVPSPPPADEAVRSWRLEGPFDSSYSLAAVNRSLARALDRQGIDMGLFSTEGLGDFRPDPAFLEDAPDVEALWRKGEVMARPAVGLRNLYPPRVAGLSAATHVLASWGWEESGLRPEWVNEFNRELNLITTVSRYVADVLRSNGVRVPIAVVGNGADAHAHAGAPRRDFAGERGSQTFRFLHVSSGFPRKGIDVLLGAWGRAFRAEDSVSLVIKTFPNPHNEAARWLQELGDRFPGHATVELIDEDLDDAAIEALYRGSDALVAPSRGEGFGLPLAEAMLRGIPVITTRHGGALDFCSDDNAWLVDFQYAYADSHLGLFNSAWAEPDEADLARALKEVHASAPADREARVERARTLMEGTFTWAKVAAHTRTAVEMLDRLPALSKLPRVVLVSTWNVRCGIASYARHQASTFPRGSLQVMASHTDRPIRPDEPFVQRCWRQGWSDDLSELQNAILGARPDLVVVQFNFGFFDIETFGRLLDRLAADGIPYYVILHSTMDVAKSERRISLRQIQPALARAARLLVHGVADLNRLKSLQLDPAAAIVPHGTPRFHIDERANVRRSLGIAGKRVLACFGYLLPDKGFGVLLDAFFRLRQRHPDLHLLLVTSLYPDPASEEEADRCRVRIAGDPHGASVTTMTAHLEEVQVHAMLQAADLLIFPYQTTQESSSGAVRFGLASLKPVACTPLPIFDDVASVVHRLPGTSAADIERGLETLLDDPDRLERHADRQARWLAEHAWPAASRRFWDMLRAPPVQDLVAQDRAPCQRPK
jgi:glycosyltransferase involved in cell wall biosynthesis